jgi:hypothetical protein
MSGEEAYTGDVVWIEYRVKEVMPRDARREEAETTV